jgi:hypothetical protein
MWGVKYNGFLQPYFRFSRPKPLPFLQSSSCIVLMKLSGPRFRRTTYQIIWQRREWNPNLWIRSQQLWPIDYRGDPLYGKHHATLRHPWHVTINKHWSVTSFWHSNETENCKTASKIFCKTTGRLGSYTHQDYVSCKNLCWAPRTWFGLEPEKRRYCCN